MPHEVGEFIVVAPANLGKSIQWADRELHAFLKGHFPSYRFRIEPFGPFAEEDEFAIFPIMNRPVEPNEQADHDRILLAVLDPNVIPEIRHVLRLFALATSAN